jgi:aminoglycoside 3-N-acetyltransferase
VLMKRNQIAKTLERAGVPDGANVLLHSSLSSLGEVEGGADAVIDGVLDVIGIDGTLMVPTFNYWAADLFDPRSTPGLTGLVTESLRTRPNAIRSLHPTHSVAAIGKRAHEFTDGHERSGALRVGSPVDKLAKANGYTILLGVRHESNSTIHVGEAYAKPWYLGLPFGEMDPDQANVLIGGSVQAIKLAGSQPGCSIAFNTIESRLRRHGEIVDLKIGAATCQFIAAQAIIDRTVALIKEREDALLCSWGECFFCTNSRFSRPQ